MKCWPKTPDLWLVICTFAHELWTFLSGNAKLLNLCDPPKKLFLRRRSAALA